MGKGGADRESKRARQAEEERQARIREGTAAIGTAFEQFDDPFFDAQQEAYKDFALPQLDEQFGDARGQLIAALTRNGTLDSSMRVDRTADLDKDYQEGRQDITSKAIDYSTKARNSVEDARSGLISSLQVTGDAQGASNAALARASALAQPEPYSPIGQAFTDATATFAQQAALEKAYSAGYGTKPRFNTGLFGTSRGAVKVT